jgi:hypothetical protein
MKDWLVAFVAAASLIGLVFWCTHVLIPLFRALYVG